MTPELSTLLAILAAGMVFIAGGVYWWISRTPTIERLPDEPLPLFGGLTPEERMRSPSVAAAAVPAQATDPRPRTPRPEPSPPPRPAASAAPASPPASGASAPVSPTDMSTRPAPVIREFVTGAPAPSSPSAAAAPTVSAPGAPNQGVVSSAGVPGTMVEGHALRFSVPAEGTLQFLPGRLEIGAGLDAGREIRFVRVDGPNGIEVTFGRAEGELYRHIQLRDKTVSRSHARLQWRDQVWYLQNLSHTNPVVHNGVEMAGDAVQPLADGDSLEMGEVLFTFRSR